MLFNIKKIGLAFLIITFIILTILIIKPEKQNIPEIIDDTTTDKVNIDIAAKNDQPTRDTISFFAEYRLERERTRGKQIELLREIVNNQMNEKKAREAASIRLVKISEDLEKELEVENLVKSKGFNDCIVIIQPRVTTVVIQSNSIPVEQQQEIIKLVSSIIECSEQNICVIAREY